VVADPARWIVDGAESDRVENRGYLLVREGEGAAAKPAR